MLPHKELFLTDDSGNGSVVDYGKRKKSERSKFICLSLPYRLYFKRWSLVFMLDSYLQQNSPEMCWEGKQTIWLANI